MRPRKLLVAAGILAASTLTANADNYSASIDACENALGDRLGIDEVNTHYNIKKMKSRSKYRDIKFSVSVFDEAHPVKKVKAKCRVKPNGTVLAIEFDQNTLPASIAIN